MKKLESALKTAVKNCALARRTWRGVALQFNRRLMEDVGRSVKSICSENQRARHQFGERELSFDKTPLVHVKMYRPTSKSVLFFLPCINSGPDCDSDDEIDLRAQKFIDEFYEQIKLQRRHYTE